MEMKLKKTVRYETLDEWNGTWNVMKRGYWKRTYQEVNISRGYSFDAVNLRPKLWASLGSVDTPSDLDGNYCGSMYAECGINTTLYHTTLSWWQFPRVKNILIEWSIDLFSFANAHHVLSLIFCFCALHNTMKINNAHRQRKKTLFTSSTKKWAEKFPIKMLRSASSHYLALHIQFSITISGHTRPCRVDAFIWENICVGVDSPSGIWKHERKVFVWKWKTNQDHVCGEILIELLVQIVKIDQKLPKETDWKNKRRIFIEWINFKT